MLTSGTKNTSTQTQQYLLQSNKALLPFFFVIEGFLTLMILF